MPSLLTIPIEVKAVTELMMVGIGLNLPACVQMTCNIKIAETIVDCSDDGETSYMSMNYDI